MLSLTMVFKNTCVFVYLHVGLVKIQSCRHDRWEWRPGPWKNISWKNISWKNISQKNISWKNISCTLLWIWTYLYLALVKIQSCRQDRWERRPGQVAGSFTWILAVTLKIQIFCISFCICVFVLAYLCMYLYICICIVICGCISNWSLWLRDTEVSWTVAVSKLKIFAVPTKIFANAANANIWPRLLMGIRFGGPSRDIRRLCLFIKDFKNRFLQYPYRCRYLLQSLKYFFIAISITAICAKSVKGRLDNQTKVRTQKKITVLFGNFSHRGGGGLPNSQNFCKLTKYFFVCKIHSEVLKHGGGWWYLINFIT